MPKTATFTTITPLPSGITRKSVLDMYRDHMAMIDLNPLVVERFKCQSPNYAPPEEYFAAWYTIKDKVSYLPGGLAQGSVSYHACFNDTPEGLATHVYAPLGLDIRGKWSVGGSLPGEPKQLGDKVPNTPRHGIYIREDVTMTCSSLLMGFVKRTFKDSHASLVEKLVERAHLLESNFANERLRALRNVEPAERTAIGDIFIAPPPDYRPWGYTSPPNIQSPQLPSLSPRMQVYPAPRPSFLSRAQTLPLPSYSPPTHLSHSRSRSDPITSPGFSTSSTLVAEPDHPATPRRAIPMIFAPTNPDPPTPAAEPDHPATPRRVIPIIVAPTSPDPLTPAVESSMYLLPSTTYSSSALSPLNHDRPISLHPANASAAAYAPIAVVAPHISYLPSDQHLSFSPFAYESPFDTHSRSASNTALSHNILDEIDDAIDQVFEYTSSSQTSARAEMSGDEDSHDDDDDDGDDDQDGDEDDDVAFEFMLPATRYEAPPPSVKNHFLAVPRVLAEEEDKLFVAMAYKASVFASAEEENILLPATKYEPETMVVALPSKTYTPERQRKDSAVPWLDKELPPVPVDG